jgi:sec-independent protein translocase protein TatA
MPQIGIVEILIILVIVLLLFGPERITKLGGELGKGIKAFKDGITGEEKKDALPKKTTEKKK